MKVSKGALLITLVVLLTFLDGCQDLRSNKNPDESTVQKDTSFQVPNKSDKTKSRLFEIYSEKDDIREAVSEISLKHIEKIKSLSNKNYTEESSKQRIDDARVVKVPGYNDDILEYSNVVEGGNLYTYYLVYEFKPRYPDEFSSEIALETLQENGWVLFDGVYLIIYQPNNTANAAYCLAKTVLPDEFLGGNSTEQILAKIVKDEIPELKLLNGD